MARPALRKKVTSSLGLNFMMVMKISDFQALRGSWSEKEEEDDEEDDILSFEF